jgi:DNA-binding ferritin-like protein (Dps family)
MMLTPDEIAAILELIEFHDDWDEVSEIVGADVAALYDKLYSMMSYATSG